VKFLTLLLEHWEAVAGLIGTVFALFTKPPSIRRPVPQPIAEGTDMNLEARLHAIADEFSIHNDVAKLKAGLSTVATLFGPVLSIGLQALAPVAAKAAQDAITAKIPGEFGATLGADAAVLISAEMGKASEAVAPAPVVE
jgi:hypothetical protein